MAVPHSPKKLRIIGIAAVVGLILGIMLALLLEYLDNTLKTASSALPLLVLSGWGCQSVSPDCAVLKTVRKPFDQQQFGQFIQAPPGIFVVQEKSATLTSTDKQGGKSFCSVLVQLDILEMSRFTGTSVADLAKMKTEAPKRGLPLTKEYLVN